MAAEIKPGQRSTNDRFSTKKPELLSKLEGTSDDINAAILIPGENGVISVSDDKYVDANSTCNSPLVHNFHRPFLLSRTVRVWLKRDSGQYWPSICQSMPSGCTSITFVLDTRQVFVGEENGTITEYTLSVDCNRLSFVRDYLAHQGRVVSLVYCADSHWILSCSKDKTFAYYCTKTVRRLGAYNFETPCTALQ